jgi:hypothetical protein
MKLDIFTDNSLVTDVNSMMIMISAYRKLYLYLHTLKNALFWDKHSQFVPHRRHIKSPLQSPASYCYVRFQVVTAVTLKKALF